MSRIHDALLRVQQEREQAAVKGDPDAVMQQVLQNQAATAAPSADAVNQEAPREPQVTVSGDLSYDLLAARCREHKWNFAPGLALSEDGGCGLEEMRTLRTRLYQLRGTMPLKTVLIASALPGEGKTFVSCNLAQIMVRQRGRRALLIDGDLRSPRLHKEFGAPVSPGLTEYLKGDADETAIMQRGPISGLMFVPGGQTAPNPAELLAGNGLRRFLDSVGHCFDWIFIDSPAAIPIADASMLAGACDGVLMVVKAGETPFDLAQKARQEFTQSRVVGVVLNRVEPKTGYNSYYYRSYGYNQESSKR